MRRLAPFLVKAPAVVGDLEQDQVVENIDAHRRIGRVCVLADVRERLAADPEELSLGIGGDRKSPARPCDRDVRTGACEQVLGVFAQRGDEPVLDRVTS